MRQISIKDEILSDRERKNLSILEAIRRNSPLTRTEISQLTGINIVTVSHYVDSFVTNGLVLEVGLDVSSGGRRPGLVELNSKAGFVIGIGMDLFNMVGILADLEMNVQVKVKKERPRWHPEQMVTSLIELIAEVIDKSGVEKDNIKGLGVGVPGIIDVKSGVVRWPETIETYVPVGIPIRELLEQKFNIPTFIGNDATIAAFSEHRLALGYEIKHMIYMYSGVGSGIIINGQLYGGISGHAGELSIENLQDTTLICQRGTTCLLRRWEVDLGVSASAKKLIGEGEKTRILDLANGKVENINLRTVIAAAKEADKVAVKLIEDAGVVLGMKVAYLMNLFNPQVMVIGGGVEEAGTILLDTVRKTARQWSFEEIFGECKIVPSRLGEDAVALGAVAIIIQDLFISGGK